jgi:hypothetical protein
VEEAATEDEIAAEATARQASLPATALRRRPVRKPLPEHLRRERGGLKCRRRDAVLEGDPDCPRTLLQPPVRGDHATAGALPRQIRHARQEW